MSEDISYCTCCNKATNHHHEIYMFNIDKISLLYSWIISIITLGMSVFAETHYHICTECGMKNKTKGIL